MLADQQIELGVEVDLTEAKKNGLTALLIDGDTERRVVGGQPKQGGSEFFIVDR